MRDVIIEFIIGDTEFTVVCVSFDDAFDFDIENRTKIYTYLNENKANQEWEPIYENSLYVKLMSIAPSYATSQLVAFNVEPIVSNRNSVHTSFEDEQWKYFDRAIDVVNVTRH